MYTANVDTMHLEKHYASGYDGPVNTDSRVFQETYTKGTTDRNIQEIIDYYKETENTDDEEDIDAFRQDTPNLIARTKTADFEGSVQSKMEMIVTTITSRLKLDELDLLPKPVTKYKETQSAGLNGLDSSLLKQLDEFIFSGDENQQFKHNFNEDELNVVEAIRGKVQKLIQENRFLKQRCNELNDISTINKFRVGKELAELNAKLDPKDSTQKTRTSPLPKRNFEKPLKEKSLKQLVELADKQIELFEKYNK